MNVQSIMEKVKELVAKGNVSRIVVRKAEKEILNIPVTVGVAGVTVGLIWARLALLAAVLATVGFGCVVEVVKADGGIVNVVDEESSQKVRDFAAETVEKVTNPGLKDVWRIYNAEGFAVADLITQKGETVDLSVPYAYVDPRVRLQ